MDPGVAVSNIVQAKSTPVAEESQRSAPLPMDYGRKAKPQGGSSPRCFSGDRSRRSFQLFQRHHVLDCNNYDHFLPRDDGIFDGLCGMALAWLNQFVEGYEVFWTVFLRHCMDVLFSATGISCCYEAETESYDTWRNCTYARMSLEKICVC